MAKTQGNFYRQTDADSIRKLVDDQAETPVLEGDVLSANSTSAQVKIRGSSKQKRVSILSGLNVAQGDHVIMLRSDLTGQPIIMGKYVPHTTVSTPSTLTATPLSGEAPLVPSNLVINPAQGMLIASWQVGADAVGVFQVEVADNTLESGAVFAIVSGSTFPYATSAAKYFRVRAADATWHFSNWTGWVVSVAPLSPTGIIPIVNGGTGQTDQVNAFNALNPTTTKGDLIGNDGANAIRVPVDSNNLVLTADNTAATGWKWKLLNLLNSITGILGIAHGGSGADLTATGGTHQFVRQAATGAVFSVGAIAAGDLPATAVTAGAYTNTNLTVDAQGRLTAASNGITGGCTADFDWAQGTTAAASDEIGSTGPGAAVNVITPNTLDIWQTFSSAPQWVSVDLGAARAITKAVVRHDPDNITVEYKLQSSNDNSSWTDVQHITGNTDAVNTLTGFSGTHRYWRLYIINANSTDGFSRIVRFYLIDTFILPILQDEDRITYVTLPNSVKFVLVAPPTTPDYLEVSSAMGDPGASGGHTVWRVFVDSGRLSLENDTDTNQVLYRDESLQSVTAAFDAAQYTGGSWTVATNQSGSDDGSHTAAKIINPNESGYWAMDLAGGSQWASIDLGSAAFVRDIVVKHYGYLASDHPTWTTADYVIESSPDNSTWTTVESVSGNTDNVNEFHLAADVAPFVRYWRIRVTQGEQTGAGHARIARFELGAYSYSILNVDPDGNSSYLVLGGAQRQEMLNKKHLDFKANNAAADPGTPPTGLGRLYLDSDGHTLKFIDTSGTSHTIAYS